MGRKQTARSVLEDLPTLGEDQHVAKIIENRGGSYEVQVPSFEGPLLVSMPSKFVKLIWVKRGSFVIVQLEQSKTKVVGEIVHVLYDQHIKHLKAQGLWPAVFDNPTTAKDDVAGSADGSDDDDDDLFVNPNRRDYDDDDESEDEA